MAIDIYASVAPLFPTSLPAGLTTDDQRRVASYDVYESMYWNVPDTYKIVPRSEDAAPIYLPTPRKMIEATNRFLAVDWDFLVNPRVGVTGDQQLIKSHLQAIWRRELMYAKFSTQKRNCLIRGDALWHVTADPNKVPGAKISIHELHPGSYFPIYDLEDPDRVVGCHIVDKIKDPDDDTKNVSRRQTYRKTETGTITSRLALYEPDKWDDRYDEDNATLKVELLPEAALPPEITAIPVYHIKNFRSGGIFGSSTLRGVETVMAAVNQSISDQDLAISLQGLGVYYTDGGPPKTADGEDGAFIMGPGDIVEISPGSSFGRVSGISGSLPGIEHMEFMMNESKRALGISDIAEGRVDVTVAESGIALYLQMAPMLAQNSEREQEMLGVYDHMLYDLVQMWLPAYEGTPAEIAVEATTVVGDPMPQNRETQIAEVLTLVTSVPPLITIEMAQAKLTALGYEFPEGSAEQVVADAQAIAGARAAADPYESRYAKELNNETEQQ